MRTVIITGANRGIGKELALGFSEEGFKTILLVRKRSTVFNLSKEIYKISKIEPDIFEVDLNNLEKLESTIKTVSEKYEKIDVLVNNAGVFTQGTLEADHKNYKTLLNINLSAPYVILQEIVKKMMDQKEGYIFNISSIAGKVGYSGYGVYSSSKFALSGLNESLFNELMEYGIKVTSLCPSYVNTEMARQAGGDFPGEEMIQPSDIMESINYVMRLSKNARIKEIVIDCAE